ncbi:MAG: hypothetical protein KFF68_07880 [Desulfosarcina sp.]|nr:hypothetical protein [Desulfosarcina sp.]
MKTFMIVVALGLACFLIVACSEKPPATMGQAEKSGTEASSQEAASAAAEVAEIDGRLVQTEKGLALATGTDAYVVAGKDLSDMRGKLVKITVTIAEVDGGQVIEVMTVAPAPD